MVSVIIPCYNYGKFLTEALESVIAQTYTDWECIIVNDGSTDNTEDVALKYANSDKRFIYIYQKNAGHAAARNTALKKASGKYIQFLDADDLLEPEKLNLQVPLLEGHHVQEIDLVYSDILNFNNNDAERKLLPVNFFDKEFSSGKNEILIDNLIDDNLFIPGCVLMRKTIYEHVGNLKASYGYEDWEFFSRAAFAGFNFYHDKREGTRLISREHGNNATGKHRQMLDSKIKVRKEIMNVIQKLHQDNKLSLSSTYIDNINKKHHSYLSGDLATYHTYYGNLITGIRNIFLHAFYSGKPFKAFNNGFRWAYLRLKGYKI